MIAAHPLAACGFLDFSCQVSQAVTGWFAGLVQSAINPVLAVIGQDLLSTPQPGSFPAVAGMWGTSLAIADAAYVLLVLAGGDPAEVQKAKIALRSAAIGYGLAVLAPVIVAILKSLTGGP